MRSLFLPTKAGSLTKAIAKSFIGVAEQAVRVKPLPFSEWPEWAKNLAKARQPGEIGLGDTAARLIGDVRSARFVYWFTALVGANCGCTERKAWLNLRFPYTSELLQEA
jgi:hypothetical protein